MEKQKLNHYKNVLTEQLDRLLVQAEISKAELASEPNQEIESLDRIVTHSNQALKLRFRSRESRLIKKVRGALDRIENGTYGECEDCEEPISLKRLDARPVTTKCIECKEHEEQLEALMQ